MSRVAEYARTMRDEGSSSSAPHYREALLRYLVAIEAAPVIKTIVLAQDPYRTAIYPFFGSAFSYDNRKTEFTTTPSVQILLEYYTFYKGGISVDERLLFLRCIRNSAILVRAGILFLNASYDFEPMGIKKVYQGISLVKYLRDLITSKDGWRGTSLTVLAFGSLAHQTSALIASSLNKDISVSIIRCTHPAAFARMSLKKRKELKYFDNVNVGRLLESILSNYVVAETMSKHFTSSDVLSYITPKLELFKAKKNACESEVADLKKRASKKEKVSHKDFLKLIEIVQTSISLVDHSIEFVANTEMMLSLARGSSSRPVVGSAIERSSRPETFLQSETDEDDSEPRRPREKGSAPGLCSESSGTEESDGSERNKYNSKSAGVFSSSASAGESDSSSGSTVVLRRKKKRKAPKTRAPPSSDSDSETPVSPSPVKKSKRKVGRSRRPVSSGSESHEQAGNSSSGDSAGSVASGNSHISALSEALAIMSIPPKKKKREAPRLTTSTREKRFTLSDSDDEKSSENVQRKKRSKKSTRKVNSREIKNFIADCEKIKKSTINGIRSKLKPMLAHRMFAKSAKHHNLYELFNTLRENLSTKAKVTASDYTPEGAELVKLLVGEENVLRIISNAKHPVMIYLEKC